jgi:hypothetical protein
MNVYGGQTEGDHLEGRWERKGHRGVKRMEICCIHTDEDSIKKLTKHCLKEEG